MNIPASSVTCLICGKKGIHEECSRPMNWRAIGKEVIKEMKDPSFEAIRRAGGDEWDGLDDEQELAAMRGQPQGTEARGCDDICERQALGIAKYGKTVSENPLELREWLQHAYEEALDMAIYLKRAIEKIDGK